MKMILGDIACLPVPGYRARNFSITGYKVYDIPPGFQDDFVALRAPPPGTPMHRRAWTLQSRSSDSELNPHVSVLAVPVQRTTGVAAQALNLGAV